MSDYDGDSVSGQDRGHTSSGRQGKNGNAGQAGGKGKRDRKRGKSGKKGKKSGKKEAGKGEKEGDGNGGGGEAGGCVEATGEGGQGVGWSRLKRVSAKVESAKVENDPIVVTVFNAMVDGLDGIC